MADNIRFANNASALLAASIDDTDTTVQVASGFGALFPSPTGDQFFYATLIANNGDIEIVKCTARSSDNLTVERAQEGTTAKSFTLTTTRVELRNTAAAMSEMLQKNGGTMTGNIDLNENEIVDAVLTGTATSIQGGEIAGIPLRGATGVTGNQISVPANGTDKATAGGQPIVTADENFAEFLPVGTILIWYGAIGNIPTGYQECDGTNGTPDLREAFPRGVGGSINLGDTGGATTTSGTTDSDGGHSHTATEEHSLTVDELPAHNHRILGTPNTGGVADVSIGYSGGNVTVGGYRGSGAAGYITQTVNESKDVIEDTGNGDGHTHAIADGGDHTHDFSGVDIIPPFVGVYFIMKIS